MRVYNYKYTPKERGGKNNSRLANFFRLTWFFRVFRLKRKNIFLWLFRLFAAGVVLLALLFLYYAKDLPNPNKLLARNIAESTKIYARDGSLLYEIHGEEKRTLVELDKISPFIKNATIAIEDKNFYKHGGISFTGIARAIVTDITTGSRSQGGSTITQQFVKNAILTNDKSIDRKVREIIISIMMETRFSKEDILKLYLNEIPYGRNAYGVEAAAQTYFNKTAENLSLAESAYLAALPQSPTRYNPFGPNRELLDKRKDTVLAAMREQGYITEEQENEAKEEKVEFQKIKTAITAPHFVLMVQDYLAYRYGEKTLQEGGLKVYTTLDLKLQKIAEAAVTKGAENNTKKYGAANAALVAIDPKTGQILAMVGSKNYFGDPEPAGCSPGKNCAFEPNVNVALSERQPGSSFKPYVYVTAFKKDFRFSPASLLMDVVTNFGSFGGKNYIPHNYNGQENGPVSMRKALAGSLNIPAVKTLALVGVNNATQTARDLGITSPLKDCGLSLVLGGCEVKLIDHVGAYSVLANYGNRHEKTAVLKVEDRNGEILEEFKDNPKEVLDPQAAYSLISIMTDNAARSYVFGANSPLTLGNRPVAAKTGTTNDWGDGWTVGFTPSLAAGVWTGNNCGGTKCPMKRGADGSFTAAPIWNQFMKEALKDKPVEEFSIPEGIARITVDEVSGKLPTQYTPSTKNEIFASYSVPTEYDDVHIGVAYDNSTGQPANSLTPPNQIIYKLFTVFHSEKRDNPNWENPVIAWALGHGYTYPDKNGSFTPPTETGNGPQITISEPADNATISDLPFRINVFVFGNNPVARVDLSIDGQFISSLASAPYNFEVTKKLSDGQHTIAVKAVDNQGQTSDTSIGIKIALVSPLLMLDPVEDEHLSFPVSLSAESAKYYSSVDFYYQLDKGGTKLIGRATNTSNIEGKYQYSYTWLDVLTPGTYYLYAQNNNGTATPKIKVFFP